MPDEEKQDDQTAKPGGEEKKPPTQEDLDKLRAELQGQVSEKDKALKEASQSRADLELQLQELQSRIDEAQSRVQLDEDTPPETKAAVKKMEEDLAASKRLNTLAFTKWADAASSEAAHRLALEYEVPDQVEALTRQFRAVAGKNGEEALKLEVERAGIKLMREKTDAEKKTKKEGDSTYDENVQSGRTPTRVVDEMKDIDTTTPEGAAEWDKKRQAFAKRAGVPLP